MSTNENYCKVLEKMLYKGGFELWTSYMPNTIAYPIALIHSCEESRA